MLLNMVLGGDLAKAVAQGQTSSEHAQLCILLQVLAVIIVKSVEGTRGFCSKQVLRHAFDQHSIRRRWEEEEISYKVHTAVNTIGQVGGRVIMRVCCGVVSLQLTWR